MRNLIQGSGTVRGAIFKLQIKKCHVEDLLNILHDIFSSVFVINEDDIYPVLQEMIGRRNVLIHRNDIANQMYLTNFNIYGVAAGDSLSISKKYFEKAVKVTKQVVAPIAFVCDEER